MKLSLESYVLREKFGDLEGLRLIRDAGFDCVDMSYYWTAEGSELLGEGYCEYARGLRKHLDAIVKLGNREPLHRTRGILFELRIGAQPSERIFDKHRRQSRR